MKLFSKIILCCLSATLPLTVYANATEENDFGIAKDFAEEGDIDSMQYLGYLYEKGIGTKQDYQQALEWYTKAAAEGNAEAMAGLGNLYADGLGVIKNKNLARFWYEKSCNNGYKDACNCYGEFAD